MCMQDSKCHFSLEVGSQAHTRDPSLDVTNTVAILTKGSKVPEDSGPQSLFSGTFDKVTLDKGSSDALPSVSHHGHFDGNYFSSSDASLLEEEKEPSPVPSCTFCSM